MQKSIALYLISTARTTKLEYEYVFALWFAHLKTRESCRRRPTELDATTFVEFLIAMPGIYRNGAPAPLTRKTICKRIAVLRKLYNIATENGEAKKNPFRLIHLRKPRNAEKRRCEEFPPDLVPRLFRGEVSPRNRALLAALFGGGLRISEAVNLQIGDVEFHEVPGKKKRHLSVLVLRHTKAQEPQEQPLPEWATEHIRLHLEIRRAEGARQHEPLFLNRGKPMTIRAASHQFFLEAARVGACDMYPHSARRCAITQLFRLGIPLADIQIFSRHAEPESVLDYDKRRLTRELHPSQLLEF